MPFSVQVHVAKAKVVGTEAGALTPKLITKKVVDPCGSGIRNTEQTIQA
jgi:hypothetical protein